jgi:hypothetical protein
VSGSDFKGYKKFFAYWCSHLIERLVRFERYLNERAGDVSARRRAKHNVIEHLSNQLGDVAKSLHEVAHQISQRDQIAPEDFTSYAARMQSRVRAIIDAHHMLAYLPQPWPEPDTEILIKSVIEENVGHLPLDGWTIVLTSEYNLSNIIIDKDSTADAGSKFFPHVLGLPAIEKDNTIVWVNLLHEVGHSISKLSGVHAAAKENVKSNRTLSAKESLLVCDWLEEIIADLVAVDFVGPAYLYAFATFALYMSCPPIRRPSKRYPSPNARFNYLFERLAQNGEEEAIHEGLLVELKELWELRLASEHKDPSRHDDTIDAYRAELDVGPREIEQFDQTVAQMAKDILALPQYQTAIKRRFRADDFVTARRMTTRLHDGLLVATRRACLRPKEWSVETVRNQYIDARSELQEQISEVTHILAASAPCRWGWDGKSKRSRAAHLQFAEDLFLPFATSASFARSTLSELWPGLNTLDELVSNSVEAVLLARFYGVQDGGRDEPRSPRAAE